MALSFNFPIATGTVLTADLLNELVYAIQDGSIFTSVSFVSSLVTTLDTRVSSLESQVAALNARQGFNFQKDQYTLTAGQSIIPLSAPPALDSEVLAINGMVLAKSDIPVGVSGDYTISGSTVTLVSELALQIVDGDRLVATYAFFV